MGGCTGAMFVCSSPCAALPRALRLFTAQTLVGSCEEAGRPFWTLGGA